MENLFIKNGKAGDYFYTDKSHNKMTGSASYYKRKIKTEHCYLVPFFEGEKNTKRIIKVTLLS